ncbi:hypothetical protein BDW69DRAFT_164119 [Aspergillus filifer]
MMQHQVRAYFLSHLEDTDGRRSQRMDIPGGCRRVSFTPHPHDPYSHILPIIAQRGQPAGSNLPTTSILLQIWFSKTSTWPLAPISITALLNFYLLTAVMIVTISEEAGLICYFQGILRKSRQISRRVLPEVHTAHRAFTSQSSNRGITAAQIKVSRALSFEMAILS